MKDRKKVRAKARTTVDSKRQKLVRKRYETFLYDLRDRIATITLNRPNRVCVWRITDFCGKSVIRRIRVRPLSGVEDRDFCLT
jgi:hypothetical protein